MAEEEKVVGKKKRKAPKTAWKKGESGNPNGRPKLGESFTDIIRAMANRAVDQDGNRVADLLVAKLIEMASNGDINALKYLIDRVDGKANQSIDLGMKENNKLQEKQLEGKGKGIIGLLGGIAKFTALAISPNAVRVPLRNSFDLSSRNFILSLT
jgi:hypothetical protein